MTRRSERLDKWQPIWVMNQKPSRRFSQAAVNAGFLSGFNDCETGRINPAKFRTSRGSNLTHRQDSGSFLSNENYVIVRSRQRASPLRRARLARAHKPR